MLPQTQPSGQSQVSFRFPHPGNRCVFSKFPLPQQTLVKSSQTVSPTAHYTKCQNRTSCDVHQYAHPAHAQPMPSPAAFRPHPSQVHEDYDCTLNQTNIGNNNNKFYIIQLLKEDGRFFCWNRWGRVVSDPLPVCFPQTSLLCTHFKSPQRATVAGCPTSPSAVERQSA